MVADSELARLKAIADAWQREAIDVRRSMEASMRFLGTSSVAMWKERRGWAQERNRMLAELERERRRVGDLEYVIGGLQSQLAELEVGNRRLKSQLKGCRED